MSVWLQDVYLMQEIKTILVPLQGQYPWSISLKKPTVPSPSYTQIAIDVGIGIPGLGDREKESTLGLLVVI